MVSQIYYITEELNNKTWKLKKDGGHIFENHIFDIICKWCGKYYADQWKCFQTEKTNDNGKDIILESQCDLYGLFGMNFYKNGVDTLKIYVECKSSDSYKIAYNSLAGNIKLSERNNINYYILVTNTTVTPYTFFQLQDESQKKGFTFCLIDQYLLYRFLEKECFFIGEYIPPKSNPQIHAEYQKFTDSNEGKTRFSIHLFVRNYTDKTQKINIRLKTDHNWYVNDEDFEIILDSGTADCHQILVDKRYYDGLDDLWLQIKSNTFEQTLTIEGKNLSHNFVPQLQGEEHNKIIDSVVAEAKDLSALKIIYMFGQAGVGKTRITDEISNRVNGTNIKCMQYPCSKKESICHKLFKFFESEGYIQKGDMREKMTLASVFHSCKLPYAKKYILFIDDIHNEDENFYDEICQLSEYSISFPAMLVLVGRDDFSEGANAYFSFINQCKQKQFPITGYLIYPLKEKETIKLIQSIITDAPKYVIQKIQKSSDNVPLYIIQYIEYMLDIELVKIINRNTVGILNPETFSTHLEMPDKIGEIYKKRIQNLSLLNDGQELIDFLFMASLIGNEFNKRTFLNYFENDETLLGLLIERYFLDYTYTGGIKFSHESLYLYFLECINKDPKLKERIACKIIKYKTIFWDEIKGYSRGSIYCWTGDIVQSMRYFNAIIQDLKCIDNYSSIDLDPYYRLYLDDVYQVMKQSAYSENYLKNALFAKIYLSLHFFTPYSAVKECVKVEETIKQDSCIKSKETFRMTVLEQKAHSYINMGQLRISENILQELLAQIIYNPDSMDKRTQFDLYDKLTNINLKYNNLAIAENYNKLAYKIAEELNDYKLIALANITYAKMYLYRDIDKSTEAIATADKYLAKDPDPRIICHNNLSKIVICLRNDFNQSISQEKKGYGNACLWRDTHKLLEEALKGKYANSIIRGYLLLATLEYFKDLELSLKYVNMGIDAGIRWGQANYMWHFYNLKAIIALRKNESANYVSKLFNTVFQLMRNQNLLYFGALDFSYENILASTNVLKYWEKYKMESSFYQKIASITYNNSIFSCNYNCDNEICNFNCVQTTEIYKKEYKKIGEGKLLFVNPDFQYTAQDPYTDYYLLFC